MSAETYIGVSSSPKKIKEIYIGTTSGIKKVKEGYIGVGGVPKLFYKSGVDIVKGNLIENIFSRNTTSHFVGASLQDMAILADNYGGSKGSYNTYASSIDSNLVVENLGSLYQESADYIPVTCGDYVVFAGAKNTVDAEFQAYFTAFNSNGVSTEGEMPARGWGGVGASAGTCGVFLPYCYYSRANTSQPGSQYFGDGFRCRSTLSWTTIDNPYNDEAGCAISATNDCAYFYGGTHLGSDASGISGSCYKYTQSGTRTSFNGLECTYIVSGETESMSPVLFAGMGQAGKYLIHYGGMTKETRTGRKSNQMTIVDTSTDVALPTVEIGDGSEYYTYMSGNTLQDVAVISGGSVYNGGTYSSSKDRDNLDVIVIDSSLTESRPLQLSQAIIYNETSVPFRTIALNNMILFAVENDNMCEVFKIN